jgi:hypothetical protein
MGLIMMPNSGANLLYCAALLAVFIVTESSLVQVLLMSQSPTEFLCLTRVDLAALRFHKLTVPSLGA